VSRLFIVLGPPGVGKTTTANMISEKIGGIVITSEQIIKELFGETSNKGKDRDFSKEEIALGYKAMLITAKRLLEHNKPVVLDGVFRSEEQRQDAIVLAKELDIPFKIVLVTCSEELVKERITKRFESGKQPGGYEVHLCLKKAFEPLKQAHFVVDNSRGREAQINHILTTS
jgi:hypothetical protein